MNFFDNFGDDCSFRDISILEASDLKNLEGIEDWHEHKSVHLSF